MSQRVVVWTKKIDGISLGHCRRVFLELTYRLALGEISPILIRIYVIFSFRIVPRKSLVRPLDASFLASLGGVELCEQRSSRDGSLQVGL